MSRQSRGLVRQSFYTDSCGGFIISIFDSFPIRASGPLKMLTLRENSPAYVNVVDEKADKNFYSCHRSRSKCPEYDPTPPPYVIDAVREQTGVFGLVLPLPA